MNNQTEHPISVSAARLKPLIDQARLAGLDIGELLTSLDLSSALISKPANQTISLADYYRVQNRLSILFGDETLHLSSRQLLLGSTDFVLQHVGDCLSLYDVMGVVAKTYNLLHGGQYNSVVKKKTTIEYIIDDRHFSYVENQTNENTYFSIECILIFLHCMLMLVSEKADTAITQLHLRRPSPGGDCDHLAYWDAPIKFRSEIYRVSFDRETVVKPISMPPLTSLTSNALYQKIVDVVAGQRAKYQDLTSTSTLVRDALARGVVEQSDVSHQMGISVATLRRRLGQEGTNFRWLRQAVLNDMAKRLLLENQSVADVSETLGFSEFRAFNRAFKDWNGVTPKSYVREMQKSRESQ